MSSSYVLREENILIYHLKVGKQKIFLVDLLVMSILMRQENSWFGWNET